MKKLNLSFLVLLTVAFACSKTATSPTPALTNTQVTTTPITAPAALTSSSDVHAQEVSAYISSANALSTWVNYFKVPASGASKSSATIKASNGRVSATQATSDTYTWTDTQTGNSVAYQITDNGTSYTWEYFLKISGANWLKVVDANEMKDGSIGYLRVFDANGSDPSVITGRYDWTKTSALYTFKLTTSTDYFNLTYNLTTKAGTIDYYEDSVEDAKLTWDNTGHGTWQTFDPAASGSW
ncbi:MAG: hypothetical protein JST48_00180 [Bacteroidetes bacterium]|nr:hypothetical protein [Bacteroidota bacterium]